MSLGIMKTYSINQGQQIKNWWRNKFEYFMISKRDFNLIKQLNIILQSQESLKLRENMTEY